MNKVRPGNLSLVIRDARSEEMDEVSLLMRDAYLEYEKFFPPEGWKLYLGDIMDVRSRLGDSQLIVAELEGHLAGAVTLYPDASRSREEWPEGWAGIRLLAVHPAYRGRGVGRALMEECVRRCREEGIRAIGLHTAAIMSIAQKMYEHMGFVRAPEYDFYPRPGTVVMAYRLKL
jgi:ribosomal protein S18 acetylase RimI-like enzyme